MPRYRVHDTAGDDLGLVEHPASNLEPGDVVELADGREALVTARVEAQPGPLEARSGTLGTESAHRSGAYADLLFAPIPVSLLAEQGATES